MPSRRARSRPEERQREFVRQFVESVPLGEREVTSIPRRQHLAFVLPLNGSKTGDVKPLALQISIWWLSEIARVTLITDEGMLTSNRIRLKLLRINTPLITRKDALRIISVWGGSVSEPIQWRVKTAKPSDFGHEPGVSPAPSISIEVTGTLVCRLFSMQSEYTVRYSLSLEAEPSPRVYMLVSIDDQSGNIWSAHSQWVPLTRMYCGPDVKAFLEGEDGEAGNRT
jgi:hypothetical protein